MNKRERAKELMISYFKVVAPKAYNVGFRTVFDLEELVDLLIDAAKEEIRAEQRKEKIKERMLGGF